MGAGSLSCHHSKAGSHASLELGTAMASTTMARLSNVFDFHPRMLHGARTMTAEEERTRLIGEIARVLRDGPVPDEARAAALTFIGWLARRMPGEPVSMCDIGRCKGYSKSPASDPHAYPGTAYAGPPSGPQPCTYSDGAVLASEDGSRSAR
jgi:hypothetical protein